MTGHRLQLFLAAFVLASLGWICTVNVRSEKSGHALVRHDPPNPVLETRPRNVLAATGVSDHSLLTLTHVNSFNHVAPALAHLWVVTKPDGWEEGDITYVRLQPPPSDRSNLVIVVYPPFSGVRGYVDATHYVAFSEGVATTLMFDRAAHSWSNTTEV